MAVVSFVSAKGGVGKSTTALVLAGTLAHAGALVSMIDGDPNQPLVAWAALPGKPEGVSVIGGVTEETMLDVIEEEAGRSPFVIVDLEGTASAAVFYAMSRSDLVLIPCQGSQLDAAQATKAVQLIRQNAKAFARKIPHAVVLTQAQAAIETRDLKHIAAQFETNKVPLLRTRMMQRAAFRALFAIGGTLYELTAADVHNPEGARANAEAVAAEVLEMLRGVEADAA